MAVPLEEKRDFNPRPPWGGRLATARRIFIINTFQSTPSVGRATWKIMSILYGIDLFQSTPSVGRATGEDIDNCPDGMKISIHALRGEGDMFSVNSLL